tara:strand:+ start:359 stop:550 length:192 start_codon:yes stop_codon:yes gene_type:complete
MAKEKNLSLIAGLESELNAAIQHGRPKKYIDDIRKALKDAGGKVPVETADKKTAKETTSKKTK